jgi:DNA polymerase-3 subunit beta
MHVIFDRSPLLAALARAQRTIERRNTIPILANVLLTARGGEVDMTATDQDGEIVVTVPAEPREGEPGAVTVPAGPLHDIVRRLPEGAAVTLETKEHDVSIRAGRSRFTLRTLPASDFPAFRIGEGSVSLAMPGAMLKAALDQVEFSISTEETRYYLCGVYLHRDEAGRLRSVATTGHCLSLAVLDAELPPDLPGIIVPRKAVSELKSLADAAGKETLAIEISDTVLSARHGVIRYATRLIDGTYPDYGRIVPRDHPIKARVNAAALAGAVERVMAVSSKKSRAVRFAFVEDRLDVSFNDPDAGAAQESVDCTLDGEPIEIGFNGRYACDVLSALACEDEVEIALRDPASPGIFRRPGEAEALCLIMPMRV